MSMPFRTKAQNQVIKNLIEGYERHMTWWMAPNPGQPYSDVYMAMEGKYLKIKPDGKSHVINGEEYMKQWALAYRAGLAIDEYHKLNREQIGKLIEETEE